MEWWNTTAPSHQVVDVTGAVGERDAVLDDRVQAEEQFLAVEDVELEHGRGRDALHFAALFDRFIQNLRRILGYDLQYFAAIEPQQRLAPHVHIAIRDTVSRADMRRVLAATYHQVWWPSVSVVRYNGKELPIWDEQAGTYLDPTTGEVLPTWDDALDGIARRMSRCMWHGSGTGSTLRACSPGRRTPRGASAT
jgi:hypothetical protein